MSLSVARNPRQELRAGFENPEIERCSRGSFGDHGAGWLWQASSGFVFYARLADYATPRYSYVAIGDRQESEVIQTRLPA